MQYVGRFVSSVYNTITPNINPATLSGAIDVIVVERQMEVEVEEEDEWGVEGEKKKKKVMTTELASTPFHVRFGKMSVLRPAERKVTLHLNNSPDPLPFAMKVGEAGEAFFVLELGEDEANEGIPDDLVTSPIISAASSPMLTTEDQDLANQTQDLDLEGKGNESLADDNHRAPRKFIQEDYVEPLDLGASRAATSQYLNSDLESNETSTIRSGETRTSEDTGIYSPESTGNEEADVEGKASSSSRESSVSKVGSEKSGVRETIETVASKASGAIGAAGRSMIPTIGSSSSRNAKLEKWVDKEQKQDKWTEETSTGASQEEKEEGSNAHQYEPQQKAEGMSRLQEENDTHPPDDIKDAKKETDRLEFQMKDRAEKLVTTTVQARQEKENASLEHGHSRHTSQEQKSKEVAADLSEESYPAPFGSGSGKTLGATETAPSTQPDHSAFLGGMKLDLVESGMEGKNAMHPAQVDSRTVRGRLRKWEEEKQKKEEEEPNQPAEGQAAEDDDDNEGKIEDEDIASKGHLTTRKEDLQYMLDMDGYKMTADGEDLAFAEGHRFADEFARIFLWDGTHQIVVSDIDGTITKSDALGHVFTMIGRDWTHIGVAKLYTDIARNGYRIMYLTSRAIGQADTTRDYLKGISQNNYKLPDGPVIMSPDRLMASLHREVILRKPEVFKMACLRDIARLFGADPRHALPQPGGEWEGVPKETLDAANGPGAGKIQSPADGAATVNHSSKSSGNSNDQRPTPFYAGFGNRITDALSYRSVNIPSSRIFTIDSGGEVKMELLELAGYKSSYIHMTDLVDQMFPPITLKSAQGNAGKPEFNDFNYWRPEILQFELPPDEELMPSPSSSPASPALSARSVRSNASIRSGASTKTMGGGGRSGNRAGEDGGTPVEEGSSRLSRFGLGKLGLSRKGSAQTIASAPEETGGGAKKITTHSNTMPPSNRSANDLSLASNNGNSEFTPTPSSPSSYGSGVTSWAAGWRRRAASPGATSPSGMQATSPLVGPVITAEPEDDEDSGEGEEDDDVSSFGGDEDQNSNQGDEVLEDDDPLLATGEIQFEWRG